MENHTLIACSSCAAPNEESARNCSNCGALLSATATLDPLSTIHAQGFAWRKSVEGKPKAIVLIAIWIMFLPLFLLTAAGALGIILNGTGSGFNGFIVFWILVGVAVISFIVLYRITYNFLTLPKKRW